MLEFGVESWIWYFFAVGIIVARLISRSLLFGSPLRLQYDDWIMGVFVLACYTVLIVMSNIEVKVQSNLFPPGFDVNNLASSERSDRRYGSKIVLVVEQMQIAVIWACKACLLILYHRLTVDVSHKSNVAIKLLAVYVALGFVVMEILYFAAWCRPFHEYWAVPTDNSQCNALINHRITNAVFNISSDLIMLIIALPLFIRSLLPLKRKLILCGIFSLGIFVILASVLNKYYSFSEPYSGLWVFWYIRESSTAILVANLPFTWTLLRKVFNLGAFDEEHPPPPTYHSSRTAGGRRTARTHQAHATAASNEKHVESPGSKDSRSMSLIGSICTPKEDVPSHVSEDSQLSSRGLMGDAIQSHDFAPRPLSPGDLERGLSSGSESEGGTLSFQQALRSTSPTMQKGRGRRLSPDGTGGYTVSVLRRAHTHLAPHTKSREHSLASTTRRPISLTPTHQSAATNDGTSSLPVAGNGGGRAATDRRIRTNSPVRPASIASTIATDTSNVRPTRPMSPTSTLASHEETTPHAPKVRGGGGGRSAADRRKRARMSA